MKNILLIEDNEAQARLMQEAFKMTAAACTLDHVCDSAAVMDYLKGRPPFENRAMPCAILLDINLPGKDGRDVLKEIRQEKAFGEVPVLVMSNSEDPRDVAFCREYHAGFAEKPSSFQALCDLASDLCNKIKTASSPD